MRDSFCAAEKCRDCWPVEAPTHTEEGRASVRARLHVVEAAAELVGAHRRGQVFRAFRDRYSHDKRLFHLARVVSSIVFKVILQCVS